MTGAVFLEATNTFTRAARESAIYEAIAAGHVPSFTSAFVDVPVAAGAHTGTVQVVVDYASVGTDDDFVRIPMSPITAQRLADNFGYVLPTRRLVDAVYRATVVRLARSLLPPGPQMMSNDYYRRHHELIEKQRSSVRGAAPASSSPATRRTWSLRGVSRNGRTVWRSMAGIAWMDGRSSH